MIAPLTGRITSPFGNRVHPITKEKNKFHNGVDIKASIGTDVVAPSSGVIKQVYNHEIGGKTIIMQVGDVRYGFCHLDSYSRHVGEYVAEGDIIATSGNSGRSTGAHLHFSVKTGGRWFAGEYLGGDWVDPETLFTFE